MPNFVKYHFNNIVTAVKPFLLKQIEMQDTV